MGGVTINPLPVTTFRPEQQDTTENYLRLKSLMGQQQLQQGQVQAQGQEAQLRQQQIQMQQRQMQDSQTLMETLAKHNGNLTAALPELQGKVLPQTWLPLAQHDAQTREANAKASADELTTKEKVNSQQRQLLTEAQNMKPDEYLQNWPTIAAQAKQLNPNLPLDPNQPVPQNKLASFKIGLDTEESYIAREKERRSAEEEAAKLPGEKAESQQKVLTLTGTGPTGITAEQKQRLQGEASGRAETKRHNQAQEAQLTPDALDMAAQQFASTGQMPNVGRGGAVRSQIINAAAAKYPKVDLATNQAAFKANEASLKNVTGTLDTLTAFENTGLKNLKQFTDLAAKIPDTGVPWLNTPVRLLNERMMGSPDQSAALAAGQVALREIARVTNDPKLSGSLTDSARGEVMGLIPQNATLPQIKKVAGILQQDMANVHGSLSDQAQAIKSRLGNSATGGNSPQGGGTPVYAKNPKTGERVMSSDGGKTWAPAPVQ